MSKQLRAERSKDKPQLLKNNLNDKTIQKIAHCFSEPCIQKNSHLSASYLFPRQEFLLQANKGLNTMALKARVFHVANVLTKILPAHFPDSCIIVLDAAREWRARYLANPNSPHQPSQQTTQKTDTTDLENAFGAWPLIEYIGLAGLDHFTMATEALAELTSLFSAEFAIRPYIDHSPTLSIDLFSHWVHHPDHHVRRLVSEGTRPLLPWGTRLKDYPAIAEDVALLLANLIDDDSEYVRRSVANHLNDISKNEPGRVLDLAQQWSELKQDNRAQQHNTQREKLITHGLRTLIKRGDKRVWPILGYPVNPNIELLNFALASPTIKIGERLEFSFSLQSLSTEQDKEPQKLIIDYAIFFMKKRGVQKEKVFRLRKLALKTGELKEISKRQKIELLSTRTIYPGTHRLEIKINGTLYHSKEFEVLV